MKVIKVMSIIGIVLFSLTLILIIASLKADEKAAIGWSLLAMLYAIPYAIVALVNSSKKSNKDELLDLCRLQELREKGIFTDAEFQEKKSEILKK